MISSRALICLISLTLIAMPTSADSATPPAPQHVTAIIDGDVAVISWTPGDMELTTFKVYGADDDGWTLLGTTTGTAFTVVGDHGAYGVSSMRNGMESDIATAAEKCSLLIDPGHIPPVALDKCIPPLGTVVKVH